MLPGSRFTIFQFLPMIEVDTLTNLIVPESATVFEAMKAIDTGAARVGLVVDDAEKLVGLVTDGDVRRALLNGHTLQSPIASFYIRDFEYVNTIQDRAAVLDKMSACSIEQLPVLDADGHLRGLHLLKELITDDPLPSHAVVMVGGEGRRLRPLTESVPKPMLPVAGRPILERIVHGLVGCGIRTIHLAVNYRAEIIEQHFEDGRGFGCRIKYLREAQPMGSGGALALLNDSGEAPIVVMNGDLVTSFDLRSMLKAHQLNSHAITVGTRQYKHVIPYGCIRTMGDQISSIAEKPEISETINAGIYILEPKLTKIVPESFYPITDLITHAIDAGEKIGTFAIDEWVDVGRPEQLAMAQGVADGQS